ncbi:MAG: DUF4268 domain-containing protein [Proteobacteria bacterium]|nr:DUF4268 domain-containing protein [Pseudomonadota bacterium]
MYQIDKAKNRIKPLTVKKFSDLGFQERDHLQEWLANEPLALGEELLIIQKEFDGFDDTRERLDLLALDKDANLVIIENKLDDSGRDVVWQALKYASYCSSLKKVQIVDIYQKYLDRYCGGGDAIASICEFLEVQDFADVVINNGNDQRLFFVAAQFRKEVTSTALWLLSHNIKLQCFKVTPYTMGESLFLNVEQVIPTPEAEEFMIGISEKEAEQKSTENEMKNRHRVRLAFWEQLLEVMRESKTDLFNNISPGKDHWLNAGSGVRGVPYTVVFGNKEARVEINMNRAETTKNKFIFDHLYSSKEAVESAFGTPLIWERLDNKKGSSIKYRKVFDGYNKEIWPEIISWLVEHMIKLESAFKGPMLNTNKALKDYDAIHDPNLDPGSLVHTRIPGTRIPGT